VTVPGTDRTQETTALDVFMADTAFPAWVEPAYRGLLERVRSLEAAAQTVVDANADTVDLAVLWARIDDLATVLDVASPANEEGACHGRCGTEYGNFNCPECRVASPAHPEAEPDEHSGVARSARVSSEGTDTDGAQ
jgi:hypothetical protein